MVETWALWMQGNLLVLLELVREANAFMVKERIRTQQRSDNQNKPEATHEHQDRLPALPAPLHPGRYAEGQDHSLQGMPGDLCGGQGRKGTGRARRRADYHFQEWAFQGPAM